jgi:hypothetical protein
MQVGLEDGSIVDVLPMLSGDIGVFVRRGELAVASAISAPCLAQDTAGVALLSQPEFPAQQSVDANLLATIAASVAASGGTRHMRSGRPLVEVSSAALLSTAACSALICAADAALKLSSRGSRVLGGGSTSVSNDLAGLVAAGSRPDDFKLLLSRADLVTLLGHSAGATVYAALSEILGAAPDAVAVRRTVGTGRWIGWHTDTASRTVQVRRCTSRCRGILIGDSNNYCSVPSVYVP